MIDTINDKNINVLISFGADNMIKIWNVCLRKKLSSINLESLMGMIDIDINSDPDTSYKLSSRSIKIQDKTKVGRNVDEGMIFYISSYDKYGIE